MLCLDDEIWLGFSCSSSISSLLLLYSFWEFYKNYQPYHIPLSLSSLDPMHYSYRHRMDDIDICTIFLIIVCDMCLGIRGMICVFFQRYNVFGQEGWGCRILSGVEAFFIIALSMLHVLLSSQTVISWSNKDYKRFYPFQSEHTTRLLDSTHSIHAPSVSKSQSKKSQSNNNNHDDNNNHSDNDNSHTNNNTTKTSIYNNSDPAERKISRSSRPFSSNSSDIANYPPPHSIFSNCNKKKWKHHVLIWVVSCLITLGSLFLTPSQSCSTDETITALSLFIFLFICILVCIVLLLWDCSVNLQWRSTSQRNNNISITHARSYSFIYAFIVSWIWILMNFLQTIHGPKLRPLEILNSIMRSGGMGTVHLIFWIFAPLFVQKEKNNMGQEKTCKSILTQICCPYDVVSRQSSDEMGIAWSHLGTRSVEKDKDSRIPSSRYSEKGKFVSRSRNDSGYASIEFSVSASQNALHDNILSPRDSF